MNPGAAGERAPVREFDWPRGPQQHHALQGEPQQKHRRRFLASVEG